MVLEKIVISNAGSTYKVTTECILTFHMKHLARTFERDCSLNRRDSANNKNVCVLYF